MRMFTRSVVKANNKLTNKKTLDSMKTSNNGIFYYPGCKCKF